jgi:tetratricopeptide (TPR) repeat protein
MTQRYRSVVSGLRVLGAVAVGMAVVASGAGAQLARLPASPNAPKLLVAPFGRDVAADSSIAALVGDAVRDRMSRVHTDKFQTITRKAVCDFLEESGFSCSTSLEAAQVGQLAHVMNARYMIDGMVFPRGQDSVFILARLLQNVRQNPLATSASVTVARDRVNEDVGKDLADRLSDKYKSFERILNCRTALEQKDYQKAGDEARRALRDDRESAGAYLCLAQVAEGMGEGTDSVQAALERAHDADSLNTIVGRQLYQIYQAKHDTTQMLHMLRHIMQVDINDIEVRRVAVELLVRTGRPDSAVTILDNTLKRSPNHADLQVLRAIALGAWAQDEFTAALHRAAALGTGPVDTNAVAVALRSAVQVRASGGTADSAAALLDQALQRTPAPGDTAVAGAIADATTAVNRYKSAGEAMERAAALDSTKIDSTFIGRTLAFYDAAGDTVGSFTWRRICTEKTPTDADCWFRYGSTLAERHDTTGAIDAMRHVVELRPEGGRGQIAMATYFAGTGEADSALAYAQAAVAADSGWRPQAAAIYLRSGYAAFQAKDYPKTIELLGQAQPWAQGQTQVTIDYLVGYSQFQLGLAALQTLQNHPALKTNHPRAADVAEACGLITTVTDNFTPAQTNIGAGAAINRDAANQVLTYIGSVLPKLPPIATRLKCPAE